MIYESRVKSFVQLKYDSYFFTSHKKGYFNCRKALIYIDKTLVFGLFIMTTSLSPLLPICLK